MLTTYSGKGTGPRYYMAGENGGGQLSDAFHWQIPKGWYFMG